MTKEHWFRFLDIFSYILLVINILFIPLVVDKNLVDLYIIPKEYLFMGLVLLNLLMFCIKVVLTKKLLYRYSILDIFVLALLALMLLSAVFSVNLYDSFFGRGEYYILNFIFLLSLNCFYFVLIHYINKQHLWKGLLDVFLLVGCITGSLFCLKVLFHFDLLSTWFGLSIWNTTDKMNSPFGLWMLTVFICSAGQLIKKDLSVSKSLANFFIAIVALASLVLLGFSVLWWLLLLSLVLLLILGINFLKEARAGWLSVLFAALILTVVLIIFGPPKQLQPVVPTEVALGNLSSWKIVHSTVFSTLKGFLLGSGPGTFSVDFSQFRPESFNYDSTAWNLRFGQPYSTLQALLSEDGLLFTLLFVFIILYVLGHALQVWYQSHGQGILERTGSSFLTQEDNIRLEVFLLSIAWLVLTVSMCFIFFGPVLWWLWWLLLGLEVSGLAFLHKNIVKEKEWAVGDTPQYNLSFSFILIVVIAIVVMAGVWGVRMYTAELLYAEAMQSKDYKTSETKLLRAIGQRANADVYHMALAQVYLLEATDLARADKPDVPVISTLMAKAVNEAKLATEISPGTVTIWGNLAVMYENAAVLVPDARDWAVKAWQKAATLEPTNATLYWRLGNNYSLAQKWDDAIKNYEQAISLKKDYLGAYSGLANAYEQTNQTGRAIETYKSVIDNAENSAEILFNYGRLLYNRNKVGDRNQAEKLWLRAVQISPDYSNALYSLGLFYELRGDRATALQYYYKVKDLNPDNKDIVSKIKALIK